MILALLIFISTTTFAPHYTYLIAIIFYIYSQKAIIQFDYRYKVVLFVVALSFINELIGIIFGKYSEINSFSDFFPYLLLIIPTMLISDKIEKDTLKWLIILILIEICLGVLQYFLGIQSFGGKTNNEYNSELLYDKHVFGISGNSSGFGFKVFLALLLYFSDRSILKLNKYIFITLIITGLLITFNRTAILASLLFSLIILFRFLRYNYGHFKTIVVLSIILTIIVLIIMLNTDIIIKQFLRGQTDLNDTHKVFSERDKVYSYFWNTFLENPIFGNFSFKYYFTTNDGRVLHAHNSYLNFLSINGLVVSIIYLAFIVRHINKGNALFITPILLSGLFQTTIFWGTSFLDIFLYYFLFNYSSMKFNYSLINSHS